MEPSRNQPIWTPLATNTIPLHPRRHHWRSSALFPEINEIGAVIDRAYGGKHWYYSRHAHAEVALSVDRIRCRVRCILQLDQTAGARCRAGASSGRGSERSDTTACIEWSRGGGTIGYSGRYCSR